MSSKRYHRLTDGVSVRYWAIAFFPLFLLLCGEDGFSLISFFKTNLFYVLCAALGLLAAVNCLIVLFRRKKRGGSKGKIPAQAGMSAAHWAVLVYLICTLLSACFSPFGKQAWKDDALHETALTQVLYVLIFLTVSAWVKPTEGLSWSFHLAMGGFCVIALLHLLGANPFGLYPEGRNYYSPEYRDADRFLGTIGNPDLVSVFLSFAAPICVISAVRSKGVRRIPGALLALLCVGIMLKIRVLCGLAGLVAGGVLCAFVLIPAKLRTKLLCLGVLVLLGAGALWYLYGHPTSVKALQEIHAMLHGRFEDSFGTGRFYIWRQILEMIPRRLWVGIGPDMVQLSELEPFKRYDPSLSAYVVAPITDAHCLPLQILYCQGLPALLAWLTAVGAVLVPWFRTRRTPAEEAIGAGLICFLIAMLFCISSVIIMPFFWYGLALLHGSQRAG